MCDCVLRDALAAYSHSGACLRKYGCCSPVLATVPGLCLYMRTPYAIYVLSIYTRQHALHHNEGVCDLADQG